MFLDKDSAKEFGNDAVRERMDEGVVARLDEKAQKQLADTMAVFRELLAAYEADPHSIIAVQVASIYTKQEGEETGVYSQGTLFASHLGMRAIAAMLLSGMPSVIKAIMSVGISARLHSILQNITDKEPNAPSSSSEH